MPRKAQLDVPGALHHLVVRGIERRKIFCEDNDRDDFLERLSAILGESRTACFAWVLMPNHFHLLLKTGQTPIATLMRRYREFVQKEAGRGRRREVRGWASRELGLTTVELARRLDLAQPTVSQSADRGERIAAEKRVTLLSK